MTVVYPGNDDALSVPRFTFGGAGYEDGGDVEVEVGEGVEILSTNKNAEIWYTTDCTPPSSGNASAKMYDGNQVVFDRAGRISLKAVAEVRNGEELTRSEVSTLNVVSTSTEKELKINSNFNKSEFPDGLSGTTTQDEPHEIEVDGVKWSFSFSGDPKCKLFLLRDAQSYFFTIGSRDYPFKSVTLSTDYFKNAKLKKYALDVSFISGMIETSDEFEFDILVDDVVVVSGTKGYGYLKNFDEEIDGGTITINIRNVNDIESGLAIFRIAFDGTTVAMEPTVAVPVKIVDGSVWHDESIDLGSASENGYGLELAVPKGISVRYKFEEGDVSTYADTADDFREMSEPLTLNRRGTLSYYAVDESNGKQSDISTLSVTGQIGQTTLIDGIVDDVDAGAEYYNLQGVRVENPHGGMFICRRGLSVTKVLIK